MDIKKLSIFSETTSAPKQVVDSRRAPRPVVDSRRAPRVVSRSKGPVIPNKIKDAKFRNLKLRIKDALGATDTTQGAIGVVLPFLSLNDPKDVVSATIEVLGDTMDALAGVLSSLGGTEKVSEELPEEPLDDELLDELEKELPDEPIDEEDSDVSIEEPLDEEDSEEKEEKKPKDKKPKDKVESKNVPIKNKK